MKKIFFIKLLSVLNRKFQILGNEKYFSLFFSAFFSKNIPFPEFF